MTRVRIVPNYFLKANNAGISSSVDRFFLTAEGAKSAKYIVNSRIPISITPLFNAQIGVQNSHTHKLINS